MEIVMPDTPEPTPIRMDPVLISRCKMPRPTPELYEAMARAGYEANQNDAIPRVEHARKPGALVAWDDLPSDFRELVISEARAMFAVVAHAAMHSGGRVKASKLKGGTDA